MSLHTTAISLLGQLDEVLVQLPEKSYSTPLSTLSNATIGQHVRHTLEFFICLVDAYNLDQVNYDNRKHDQVIETDLKIARSVIKTIDDFLIKHQEDKTILLQANYNISHDETISIRSSFFRELAYNIEHAIHHMALMKIGIAQIAPDVKLPPHFGVASSTVRFHQQKS